MGGDVSGAIRDATIETIDEAVKLASRHAVPAPTESDPKP